MAGCGEGLVKLLVWIFNFIVFLLGLGLTIIGIIATAVSYGSGNDTISKFNDVIKDQVGQDLSTYGALGVSVLVFGLIVTVISFLGCCGVLKESKCMLYTFAICIAIFVIAQLAAGIATFVFRGELEDGLKDAALQSINQTRSNAELMNAWDELQKAVKCCGVNDANDWATQKGTPFSGNTAPPKYPDSCCTDFVTGCASNDTVANPAFSSGCYSKIYDELSPYAMAIGLGAIIFCLIEILAIVFACCLGSNFD